MAVYEGLLGPQNDEEMEVFAIEALVFSVQVALQRAMNKKGVSGKELAERLGMSPARVSQIFSEKGPNLTLKTIAKIQHALGEEFELISKSDLRQSKKKATRKLTESSARRVDPRQWREVVYHNENRRIEVAAA